MLGSFQGETRSSGRLVTTDIRYYPSLEAALDAVLRGELVNLREVVIPIMRGDSREGSRTLTLDERNSILAKKAALHEPR